MNASVYIGQAENHTRWGDHKTEAKSGRPELLVEQEMKRIGIDHFICEVIASCRSKGNANHLEQLFIKQYNSHISFGGYNVLWGNTNHNPTISDENFCKINWPKDQELLSMVNDRGYTVVAKELKIGLSTISNRFIKRGLKHNRTKIRGSLETNFPSGSKHPDAKLTEEQVLEIVKLFNNGKTKEELSKLYNVSKFTIKAILNGQRWSHTTNIKTKSKTPKLNEKQILEIAKLSETDLSQKEIASIYNINGSTVSAILTGHLFSNITNIKEKPRNKISTLTKEKVLEIVHMNKTGMTQKEIVATTGIDRAIIHNILIGRNWFNITGIKNTIKTNGSRSKLTKENVLEIVEMHKTGITHNNIATIFNVSRKTIGNIINGARWSSVTGIIKSK